MSTRRYESDYSKLQEKRRVELSVELQKGTMDKFIKIKNELENTGKCSLNVEEGLLRDLLVK